MLRSGLPCEVGESGRERRIVEGRVVAETVAPTCGELVRRFRATACPTDAELRLRRGALAKGGDIGVAEATERAQRRAGLTQEELVARCGLSVEGLRKIERDRAVPQPDTLRILVRALDLSAADARLLRRAAEGGRVARVSGHNLKGGGDGIPAPLDRFVGRATLVVALTDLLAAGHGGVVPATTRSGQPVANDGAPRDLQPSTAVPRPPGATTLPSWPVDATAEPCRLLVLTGIGGSGKTRVALAVAAANATRNHFAGGVRLVDLAAIPRGAGAAAVERAVAESLGLRSPASRLSLASLIAAIQGRTLLLLDNCEHLIDACRTLVVALLRACPDVQILATSREALGIAGERLWPLPPLALPPEHEVDPVRLGGYEAVALFVDRAAARVPGFALDADAAPLVARICTQLDGLPLALELAAARLPALSLGDLAARLDDRFALLSRGNGAAPPRQQTLRATMDWSYDLLSGEAAQLLGRLSVFAGGWTLAAAERVCAGEGLQGGAILEALTELVDRSLVRTSPWPLATGRYWLLETVRQYARLRTEEGMPGIAPRSARLLHLRWCLSLAAWPEPAPPIAASLAAWAVTLDPELDNLRAALLFGEAAAQGEGLALAASLWPFWLHAGSLREGRRWLERLLAAPETDGPQASMAHARAEAWYGAGMLAERQGASAQAGDLYRRSLAAGALADRGEGDEHGSGEAECHPPSGDVRGAEGPAGEGGVAARAHAALRRLAGH